MNHYGCLWVLTSTAWEMVLLYVFTNLKQLNVYGSLITDLGITDSTVVLGDLVQI